MMDPQTRTPGNGHGEIHPQADWWIPMDPPQSDWTAPVHDERPTHGRQPSQGSSPVQPEPDAGAIPIYLAPSTLKPRHGMLLSLARFYQLDVWGSSSLLGFRTSEQLGVAALLLSCVACFEFGAWSLLFNAMLHQGLFVISRLSLAAAALGSLYALAILLYEKSLITADFSASWLNPAAVVPAGPGRATARFRTLPPRALAALGLRVGLIALSAYATAQPLELALFNGAINQRLEDESLLAEALYQARDQVTDQVAAKAPTESQVEQMLNGTREHTVLKDAQTAADEARAAKSAADRELAITQDGALRARATVGYWTKQLKARRDAEVVEEFQVRVAERELEHARSLLSVAQDREARAKRQVQERNSALVEARGNLDAAISTWTGRRDNVAAREAEVAAGHGKRGGARKAWMERVRNTEYGTPLQNDMSGTQLQWKSADFVDRLAVLEDLRAGNPPRWPLSTETARKQAIDVFQLPDTESTSVREQAQAHAAIINRTYRGVIIAAFFIPLLTVGFKFWLMGPELQTYYSVMCQANAGCHEAVEVLRARGIDVQLS